MFDRDVKTIGKHIANALKEELSDGPATVAKFATVQIEGNREVTRQVEYYNLDMIISVGYRVKSKRGVEFRQWATNVLKDYLIKGYAINQRIREENYQQMVQLVRSMARTVKLQDLSKEVRNALLDVVVDYTFALDRLDEYLLSQRFTVVYNFNSNHMDGNTLTYGQTHPYAPSHITA